MLGATKFPSLLNKDWQEIIGATINNSIINIINCYAIGDIKHRTSGITGGKLIGGSNMIYLEDDNDNDINIGNITVTAPSRINITKCFSNDSTKNDSDINTQYDDSFSRVQGDSIYYNNVVGKYYTNFVNDNNTSIILNKKTFMVDVFNNQI